MPDARPRRTRRYLVRLSLADILTLLRLLAHAQPHLEGAIADRVEHIAQKLRDAL